MGRSGSSSASSNSTVVNTNNYALQGDNEGVAVMGNGNTVTTTDHGAVNAAFDLGKESLFFADAALSSALAYGEGIFDESMDSVSDLTDKHIEGLNDLTMRQASQSQEQVEAIKELAQNVQTGGEAVIAETSKNMLRAVMVAVTIMVVMVILSTFFGSKK
ncbi:hypothetical protein ACQEXU_13210 [Vibrio sp. TRT 21S02]|uniref:hypothetical protein n=1 Tax=Vibrio sp. TRT 21S02 TaxID=3418507 RepID=UPI003CF4B674